jgi:thiol-disulfide isomerase/thioredoxin
LTDGRAFDLNSTLGKVVLVHYWATWCDPCTQDMQILRELQTRYGQRGFSLVGVNLDTDTQSLAAHLKTNRLTWPQMHEAGGLDGPLAVELGVLTLPTMVLIDETGKVINRNIHVSEVEGELRKRIK